MLHLQNQYLYMVREYIENSVSQSRVGFLLAITLDFIIVVLVFSVGSWGFLVGGLGV